MGNIFIDGEGFEWTKDCTTCDRYNRNKKPTGSLLTKPFCTAYNIFVNEKPFNDYYNASSRANHCLKYHKWY